MTIHVNSLPDLCLRKVFWRVPVRDLLQVGCVCTKWRFLQRSVGFKVRKLTLVINCQMKPNDYHNFSPLPVRQAIDYLNTDGSVMYPQAQYPTWETVHLKYLNLNALIRLTVLFPNMSTLQVGFNTISMYQLCAVTILLRFWHANLTAFTLYISHITDGQVRQIPSQISEPLIGAINSLSAIKHLSLKLCNIRFGEVQLDLPVLAQLDQFDYSTIDNTDVLFNSFGTYAVSNHTLRLKYDSHMQLNDEHLARYYQLGHRFCAQFDAYDPRDSFILSTSAQLQHFCEHFSAITSLTLTIEDLNQLSLQNVFANLSHLRQLVNLSLAIVDFVQEDDPVPLAHLPSLISFELYTSTTYNHNSLALLNIPLTMPNLQMILVYIDVWSNGDHRCDLCDIHVDEEEEEDNELVTALVKSCLAQVMLPLRLCTRLHTIRFYSELEDVFSEDLTLDDLSRPLIFD